MNKGLDFGGDPPDGATTWGPWQRSALYECFLVSLLSRTNYNQLCLVRSF